MSVGQANPSASTLDGYTVRQRVQNALYDKLTAMRDGSQPVWSKTYKGDLDDLSNLVMPVASVDYGTEDAIGILGPCQEFELPVFFHFRFEGNIGVDEFDIYGYYLGLLQQAMLSDHQLGGLITNIQEDSNTHTIVGVDDVMPGGTLHLVVRYKTRMHNPYKLPSET